MRSFMEQRRKNVAGAALQAFAADQDLAVGRRSCR
jgi:hypothetical protein